MLFFHLPGNDISSLLLKTEAERIVISNPTSVPIQLRAGCILADSFPSTKAELVLPEITIPSQETLTVFTCPGKEEYAKPSDFKGSYIEWSSKRGTLKKTPLFPKG